VRFKSLTANDYDLCEPCHDAGRGVTAATIPFERLPPHGHHHYTEAGADPRLLFGST
jgi:hypothetical protein